jgi:hypothetical protein
VGPSFEREAFFFEVLRELKVLNPSTNYRTNLIANYNLQEGEPVDELACFNERSPFKGYV